MKTKKLSKKLTLSRKTIANLNNRDLGNVRGGDAETNICLPTNNTVCGTVCTCYNTCNNTCPNTCPRTCL